MHPIKYSIAYRKSQLKNSAHRMERNEINSVSNMHILVITTAKIKAYVPVYGETYIHKRNC